MHIISKNTAVIIGACAFGGFIGFLICNNGYREKLTSTIAIAAGGALPTALISHLIIDTVVSRKTKEVSTVAENAIKNLNRTLDQKHEIQIELSDLEKDYTAYKLKAEEIQESLSFDLKQLNHELRELTLKLSNTETDKKDLESLLSELQQRITELNSNNQEQLQSIKELKAETVEWERKYNLDLETEVSQKFKIAKQNEIQKIFDEHDAITRKAMELFERLQAWGHKVAEGHRSKKQIIQTLASTYNQNIDILNEAVNKERLDYLTQIELLNERVGMLQRQLAGDLTEPVYRDFKFDRNGDVANEIASLLFRNLKLPLSVKGVHAKSDGVVEIGYGYSRSVQPEAIVEAISRYSQEIVRQLHLFKITSVRKLEITDCIVVSFRREPALKESDAKLIAGSPEEFLDYITAHPIRYRLIADPQSGKTPTTAVMVSAILKEGGTRGNTGKGARIPHTLVDVSCPDVASSQKDADYPLEPFLKYGTTTAAIKSFGDAVEDWQYRKRDIKYAENFFQLWVWDELDNTLDSCDDPKEVVENKLRKILKQAHHTGVGWIVSGQSVMTKQIPGFTNDDRSLFTEIIIGIPKIRKYLQVYGKGRNSESNLSRLSANLDDLEEFIDSKNCFVTDDARLLRVALIVDSRSPKLYFLPNLDLAKFDANNVVNTRKLSNDHKRVNLVKTPDHDLTDESQNPCYISTDQNAARSSNPPIGVDGQSDQKPHCPHCNQPLVDMLSDGRYSCKNHKPAKRISPKSVSWK